MKREWSEGDEIEIDFFFFLNCENQKIIWFRFGFIVIFNLQLDFLLATRICFSFCLTRIAHALKCDYECLVVYHETRDAREDHQVRQSQTSYRWTKRVISV